MFMLDNEKKEYRELIEARIDKCKHISQFQPSTKIDRDFSSHINYDLLDSDSLLHPYAVFMRHASDNTNAYSSISKLTGRKKSTKAPIPSNTMHDSLERINLSLQKLIEEGQESLSHTKSQVQFNTSNTIPEVKHSLCHITHIPSAQRHSIKMKRNVQRNMFSKVRSIHQGKTRHAKWTKRACLPFVLHVVFLCILQLLSPRSLNRLRVLFSLLALLPLHRKHTHPIITSIDRLIIRFF
ncbi:hypothetical protein BD560DRAFT_490666 [Blakeslea trispora]|nr:hypothetical protein BD560DRAFT_490666 [Blakeslea trispora]